MAISGGGGATAPPLDTGWGGVWGAWSGEVFVIITASETCSAGSEVPTVSLQRAENKELPSSCPQQLFGKVVWNNKYKDLKSLEQNPEKIYALISICLSFLKKEIQMYFYYWYLRLYSIERSCLVSFCPTFSILFNQSNTVCGSL